MFKESTYREKTNDKGEKVFIALCLTPRGMAFKTFKTEAGAQKAVAETNQAIETRLQELNR